jgi:steroid 5-alpha reductase family enzyme
VWTIARNPRPLCPLDAIAFLVFVVLLVGETVADQQRWNFQTTNPGCRVSGGGVLRTGLYRYSRHPNYFCEIGLWWVVFAFAAIAAGTPWLGTVAGAVLLTLLFIGSTLFTEQISLARHPAYSDYQRTTSMLIPWPPAR